MKIGNSFLRFAVNLLIFLALIIAIDQMVGKGLEHFYFSEKSGVNFETTYSMDSTKADVVVLGSSRANHHFIPSIIEDSLHMSCHNAGRSAMGLFYNASVLASILHRYSPKTVILEFSPVELYYDKDGYESLSVLMPYYYRNPEIRSYFDYKSKYETIKFKLHLYAFNSTLHTVVPALLGIDMESEKRAVKGYIPLHGELKADKIKNRDKFKAKSESDIDPNKVDALKKIISNCKAKGITLVVIQSPRFHIVKRDVSCDVFDKLCKEENVCYLDYSNTPPFDKESDLFRDVTHLNDTGATLFTTMVTKELKKRNNQMNISQKN